MQTTYETFYDKIKSHNGTLRITIPEKVARFGGFKRGDNIKVLIVKEEGDKVE
jgi:bifunctional DNA-binding transcriptional regulator/antitoxin component of YhaV-PrlF toxin-antitoxin module